MQYIDKYRVLKELGNGGFGKVYLVEDEKTNHVYALKLLKSIYNVQRVKTHLEVLKILNTSKLFTRIYISKRLSSHLMILMEYVESENLEELTNKKVFTELEALEVLNDILDSLEFLHNNKYIHGDVKAENILKRKNKYLLIDFDIVKNIKLIDTVQLQGDDEITAPEIYKGEQNKASDIYSLGCVLYFLLTGKHIYGLTKESDFSSIMFSHLYMPLKKSFSLSKKMFYIISRMTEKNYKTRATIKELRSLLQEEFIEEKFFLKMKTTTDNQSSNKVQRYKYMAEDGVAYAQNILGLLLEEGIDVSKNLEDAFFWYRKAAKQGLAKAEFNLGLCYKYAKGCIQNDVKAFKYFSLAAQKNHSRSFYYLAKMHEEGIIGKVDLKQADSYYKKAALNGYRPAYKKLFT